MYCIGEILVGTLIWWFGESSEHCQILILANIKHDVMSICAQPNFLWQFCTQVLNSTSQSWSHLCPKDHPVIEQQMVPFRLKSISQAADTFRGHMANNGACTYHNHSIRILSHSHTSILPCGCVPNTSENMVASNIDSTSRVSILNLHIRQASVCPAQAKSTMITS